jgi:hypothetical protein
MKKEMKHELTCHCCGEKRWFVNGQEDFPEHHFFEPEHNTLVFIRVFYMHDEDRAIARIAPNFDMTVKEFKATRK